MRRRYSGVDVADHHCQYVVHFPNDQDDEVLCCDKPAGIKFNDHWLCAEHYDKAQEGKGYAFASSKGGM